MRKTKQDSRGGKKIGRESARKANKFASLFKKLPLPFAKQSTAMGHLNKLWRVLIIPILLVSGLAILVVFLPILLAWTLIKEIQTPVEKATVSGPESDKPIPLYAWIGFVLLTIITSLASGSILLDVLAINELCFRPSRSSGIVCFDMHEAPISFVLGTVFFYLVFWLSVYVVAMSVVKLSKRGSPS